MISNQTLLTAKSAIDDFYPDGVDAIREMYVDGSDNLIIVFRDGDKVIELTANPSLTDGSYRLIDDGDASPDDGQTDALDHTDDRYSHINFVPPVNVRKAFKQGLALHEAGKTGKGLEAATVREAKAIVRGEAISPQKVDKGYRFFIRNARFASMPKGSDAFGSWWLWGGSIGRAWFNDLKRQMNAADARSDASDTLKGKTVSWKYGEGIATGTIVRTYNRPISLKLQGSEIKRNGSDDNPALLIEQENGSRVLKLQSEVRFDARSDSLHLDKDCGKGSIADNLKCHAGESAGQVAAWGAGKVVGGAIAHVAVSHGIDPAAAKVISESAVQALAATAIHARNGNTAAGELAKKFVTEAASAFIGKNMAGFDDAILGGDDDTRSFLESVSSQPLSKLVSTTLKGQAQTLKGLLTRTGVIRTDAKDSLSDAEQEALFDLALVGYVMEKDERGATEDDRTDALPTFTKRLTIQGVRIGITHEPGDRRFPGSVPMQSYYGLALGTYGMADDGKSIDMYLGHDSSSEDLWKISQTTPDGEFDEYKYGTNYSSGKAFRDAHIYHAGIERSGVLSPASWDELRRDGGDGEEDDRTDEEDWHEDAAAKKCTPGKSHFCRTPTGKGSCVSISKSCRYSPTGELKKKADRVSQLIKQSPGEAIVSGMVGGDDRVRKLATDALDSITAIHDTPGLKKIPVVFSDSDEYAGVYRKDGATPLNIELSSSNDVALTLVHEMGHAIDHQLFGTAEKFGSFDNPELDDWWKAIEGTKAAKRLDDLLETDKYNYEDEFTGESKTAEIEKPFIEYLSRTHEIFARSYAQYIATKSNNQHLKELLQWEQGSEVYPLQWDDEDFKPVAKAFDQIFKKKGWLKNAK